MDKTIYRVRKDTNFVTINKTGLQDTRLSWKAKGLLAYMLCMPDNWKFHNEELACHSTDGVAAVKSAIKELKECGYVVREAIRDEKGKVKEWGTFVYEVPKEPEVDNQPLEPEVENPPAGQPSGWESHPVENRPLLNNDLLLNIDFKQKDRLIDSEIDGRTQEQLPSKPESKGDGMPITVSGAVQEEISPANWFGIVEERYLQRRGSGVCISARDGQQITSIIREGIPLETILTGIDRAFETKEKSKEYDGDTIRSFAYCAKVIRQLHHEQNIRARAAADLQGYTPVQPKQPIPNDLVAPNNQEVDAELEELLAQMEEGDE